MIKSAELPPPGNSKYRGKKKMGFPNGVEKIQGQNLLCSLRVSNRSIGSTLPRVEFVGRIWGRIALTLQWAQMSFVQTLVALAFRVVGCSDIL
jgi:hypothetical protein